MLIPSMNDPVLSYGPYQHTQHSVNPVNSEGRTGGARIANDRFAKGQALPAGDISSLPLSSHHAAAYLLALHNIAVLVSGMPEEIEIRREIPMKKLPAKPEKKPTRKSPEATKSKKETKEATKKAPAKSYAIERKNLPELCLELLSRPKTERGEDFRNLFVGFIAGAHNTPGATNSGFGRWVELYARGETEATEGGELGKHIRNAPTASRNADNQSDRKIPNASSKRKDAVRGNRERAEIQSNRRTA